MNWMLMRFHKGQWTCCGEFYYREQAVDYMLTMEQPFPGEYTVMQAFDGRLVN